MTVYNIFRAGIAELWISFCFLKAPKHRRYVEATYLLLSIEITDPVGSSTPLVPQIELI